ncbi:MAG: ABC transporter substrate-binding protein [Desulfobacterales bacterium]|nr:MAG: ABC transporter substrate-binding protein [Desulfobacterales bacterium]
MIRQHLCRKIGRLILALAALFTLLSAGAGQGQAQEEVTYRLKWLFNVSVVGDLYAEAHGIFAENGLHVTVKPGGPERDAIKELELGRAQFGVASADQVIRAVAKGAPIVVLAQLFQANPLQWIYRPDKTAFKSPADLKGKTIGITYGGNDETILRALLAKHHIGPKEVNLFSVRYDFTPFYEGKVDFWPLYRNAQAPIIGAKLRKAGEPFRFLSPDEFGIRFVANSVITARKMLAEHPALVKRFMGALLRGWRDALDPRNREKAVQTLLQFDRETPEEIVREQLPLTRSLMRPSPDFEFGKIDVAAWKQTEEIMRSQKLIPGRVRVEELLAPVGAKE